LIILKTNNRFRCGGWETYVKGLKFTNVFTRVQFRWNYDIILRDMDGSLTGHANGSAVAADNITLNDPNCFTSNALAYENGVACKSTEWIRFAFDSIQPNLVQMANITNEQDQMVISYKLVLRLTYKNLGGFMFALEANHKYTMVFDQAANPTNVSFSGALWNFKPGQYVIMQLILKRKPDVVQFGGSTVSVESLAPLTSSMASGSWYWTNSTLTLSFILGNTGPTTFVQPFLDVPLKFEAYVCQYAFCQAPVSPALLLPITSRPTNALYWSNLSTWNTIAFSGGYVYTQNGSAVVRAPMNGDNVRIPLGVYVVVDTELPVMKYLEIEGYLEFDNGRSHALSCDILLINGGQLIIGWENDPILTDVTISITGNKTGALKYMLADRSTTIGYKAIGVFGGMLVMFY
jgi:hypothetical protein